MADPKHVEILKQGVEAWNNWRNSNHYLRPDLRGIDLQGVDTHGAYLAETDLSRVDFSGRDLSGALLYEADFTEAKFNGTNLTKADLRSSNLFRADLIKATMEGAELQAADFRQAYLMGANLKGIYMGGVDFSAAALANADFTGSTLNATVFGENYLDDVRGLDAVIHNGPSIIGIETIFLSEGKIPEVFLRGCGVPESFIIQIPSLITAMQPIQFYSCFISYSSKDQEFAERLHADLRAKGVRVWFAPHDMAIGARIRPTIDESIRVYDKLLLVLSETSVDSQWVEQEVETALEKERESIGRTVLFPIRIDDAVMNSKAGWPALIKRSRNIGDFHNWKEHGSYIKSFERLLRDLKATAG